VIQDYRTARLFMPLWISNSRRPFLHLADKVESISGVWDLPMIGAERLDVSMRFNNNRRSRSHADCSR